MSAIAKTSPSGARSEMIATALPASQPAAPQTRTEAPVIHEIDAAHRAQADQRTEDRAVAALRQVAAIRHRARNVHVTVTEGVVTLFGAVSDSAAAREIEQAVRAVAGAAPVENRIHNMGARCGD